CARQTYSGSLPDW
nr:immunoglobulin heavy chain junction region [Macaca mulatta]